MAQRTTEDLASRYPHPPKLGRAMGNDGMQTATLYAELQDSIVRATSRIRADADDELLNSNPTTPNTIILYGMNVSAGDALIAGLLGRFAAQVDVVLLGAGAWAKSWALDGSAAVALTADGKTYSIAIVALIVNGAIELHAVFGAEADDASEVEPDKQAIAAALSAAGIADLAEYAGMVVGRIKIQRVATDTITMTHTDPLTDAALATDRSASNIFGVGA